jgi:hypothetical protein
MECPNKKVRAVIDVMFLKGFSARRWRSVREHLYACRSCRAYYDRVVTLHNKMHKETAPLSSEQLKLVSEEILDRMAPRRAGLPGRAWAYAGISLAVVATAVLVVLPMLEPQPASDFQARGVDAEVAAGVRAFCITAEQGAQAPRIRSTFPVTDELVAGAGGSCNIKDVLRFAYTNGVPGRGRAFDCLFLLGINEQLQPLWYYPHPDEKLSVRIQSGPEAVNVPLPGGVRLEVNHAPGLVRIYGLFSEEPLTVSQVEQRLTELREQGAALPEVESLGLDGVGAETSFWISIEE